MKISYNWLKEIIDFDWSPEELAHQLTMIGLEVESVSGYGQGLDQIVVGKVLSQRKHPQADKLSLCQVDLGGRQVQIVCGAPNVGPGQAVPVVLPGNTLPDGTVIQAGALRGEISEGMICSKKELGLADSAEGIFVLPGDIPPGKKLPQAIPVADTILEVEVFPNRPDCFSHIGIAREIRGLTGNRVKLLRLKLNGGNKQPAFTIRIENREDCYRYAGRLMQALKIKESPYWLQQRLEALGLRPINNVVDITNYVLLEYGHPLHAFDADQLAGDTIIVRRAGANEKLVTIDKTECELDHSVLVIADAEKPVALAGIMGGADSEVTGKTGRILLESAYFHPTLVRKAARKLGFSTEASLRFERGMDPNNVVPALNRTVELISKLAKGKCVGDTIDVYSHPVKEAVIALRPSRIGKILGVEIPAKRTRSILKALGCRIARGDKTILSVSVPTFRVDLTREVDLIEEVARIYNYDNIGIDTLAYGNIETEPLWDETATGIMRERLCACGMQEVVTNSLVRVSDVKKVTPQVLPVMVQNAISRDMDALRTSLLISFLPIVQWNVNRQCPDLRVFEINKVFRVAEGAAPPKEKVAVAGIATGQQYPSHWGRISPETDLYDLKGVVESFLDSCRVPAVTFSRREVDFLEPGGVTVATEKQFIGCLGRVKTGLLKHWDIEKPVYYFELEFQAVAQALAKTTTFTPLPKYPSLWRDLSLVVDRSVPVNDLINTMRIAGNPLVNQVGLFDLYQGDTIPAQKRSLGFRLEYRSDEKTLNEQEAETAHLKIISVLKNTFNAQLRSA